MKEFILKAILLFAAISGFFCGCFAIIFSGQLINSIIDNKPLFEPCFNTIVSILGCSMGFSLAAIINDKIN